MKKGLLSLFGAALVATSSFAADAAPVDSSNIDTTYDAAWWDTLNAHYCVKLETSNEVKGLKDLTADHCNWKGASNAVATNDVTVEANKLKIVHTRLTTGDNWTDVSLEFVGWFGGTEVKFGASADTVAGMYVNMADDIIITADVTTDVTMNLRLDIMDVNGHVGNSNTQRYETVAAGAKNSLVFDFEEKIFDWYGGDFWGVSNGRYSTSALTVGDYTKKYGAQAFIPFDGSKVAKMMFGINDAGLGTVKQAINIEIENIIVGDPDEAVSFKLFDDETLAFNPENVSLAIYELPVSIVDPVTEQEVVCYPNPATDIINVDGAATVSTLGGVIVAEGVNTVDVSALTAGTYIVTTDAGTTLVVIQ